VKLHYKSECIPASKPEFAHYRSHIGCFVGPTRLSMWDLCTKWPQASRWTHVGCPFVLLVCLSWTQLGFLYWTHTQTGHRHHYGPT